jgi:hypothetical protein
MRRPRSPALGAHDLAAKPRHFGIARIARHVDQGLVAAGVIEVEVDQWCTPSSRILPSAIGGPGGCLGITRSLRRRWQAEIAAPRDRTHERFSD